MEDRSESPKRREAIPDSVKAEVLARDGPTCQICGLPIGLRSGTHPLSISFDHVEPVALGGTNSVENLRVAHLLCNVRRGTGSDHGAAESLGAIFDEVLRERPLVISEPLAAVLEEDAARNRLPETLPPLAEQTIIETFDTAIACAQAVIEDGVGRHRELDVPPDELCDEVYDLILEAWDQRFDLLPQEVLGLAPIFFSSSKLDLKSSLLDQAGIKRRLDDLEVEILPDEEPDTDLDSPFGKAEASWRPVEDAKQSGDIEKAARLVPGCLSEVEEVFRQAHLYFGPDDRELVMAPPATYFRDAAVIFRKSKLYDQEVSVLEQYSELHQAEMEYRRREDPRWKARKGDLELIEKRLPRARELAARSAP